ncbi:MAG: hypothetical protein H6574_01845 [Lewinellaceae bacterium]|nr:hypothetical protein [Saprospiraceae bacterium]MCB9315010.1 hypothetical protein [Lewinellaceae bacterium]MCB9329801.1 hypothetical protein [Lewinellaceae bacterium]
MKRILVLAFTFPSICCLTSLNSSKHQFDPPSQVILQDTSRNTTLQFTKNGSTWAITSGDQDTYLAAIADQIFGVVNVGSFQNSTIEFDSSYTIAIISAVCSDTNGKSVPIGVEFAFISQSANTAFTYQFAEAHTCTGAPCSCCVFVKNEDGTIKGCKCDTVDHDCQLYSGPNRCNHSVSTN